jgi:hypothetical protein
VILVLELVTREGMVAEEMVEGGRRYEEDSSVDSGWVACGCQSIQDGAAESHFDFGLSPQMENDRMDQESVLHDGFVGPEAKWIDHVSHCGVDSRGHHGNDPDDFSARQLQNWLDLGELCRSSVWLTGTDGAQNLRMIRSGTVIECHGRLLVFVVHWRVLDPLEADLRLVFVSRCCTHRP